jgi:hypothetical protein
MKRLNYFTLRLILLFGAVLFIIQTNGQDKSSSFSYKGLGQPGGSREITTCPEESFFSYMVDINNPTNILLSDDWFGTTGKVYQKVTNLADEVGKITFWGIAMTWSGGWYAYCSGEDPVNFLVEFWEDGSTPGANIASYLVTATVTNVGNLWGCCDPLYEYTVEFPNVAMNTGWISIYGQAAISGTDCKFWWVSTETMYGPTLQFFNGFFQDPGNGVSQSICLSRGPDAGVTIPLTNWALFIGIGLIMVFAVVRFRKLV